MLWVTMTGAGAYMWMCVYIVHLLTERNFGGGGQL